LTYNSYVKRNYQPDLRIGPAKMTLINQANVIIARYAKDGYSLTLRQLYYQFVKDNLLPNRIQSYKRLGDAINDGRLAGLVDWNIIIDRTRGLRGPVTWPGPKSRMKAAAEGYTTDKWITQPVRPEIWIEKDALIGVVEDPCYTYQVDYFSNRGFTSQSAMYEAAQRIRRRLNKGQDVHIFHLGDHDPSGIDMSRDIESRLRMFLAVDLKEDLRTKAGELMSQAEAGGALVLNGSTFKERYPEQHDKLVEELTKFQRERGKLHFDRIGLNMDQIDELRPPPNPAKFTDSRAKGYIDTYGYDSWELDALPPDYMVDLVRRAILSVRDERLWGIEVQREIKERKLLKSIADNWTEVRKFVQSKERELDEPVGERGSTEPPPQRS
jgi:hypothetical protein